MNKIYLLIIIFFIGCGDGNNHLYRESEISYENSTNNDVKNEDNRTTIRSSEEENNITKNEDNTSLNEESSNSVEVTPNSDGDLLETNNSFETINADDHINGNNSDNNHTIETLDINNNNNNNDDSNNMTEVLDTNDNVEANDENISSSHIDIDKVGKVQLGVIANATVKIYELHNDDKELIATEITSSGKTVETIGNFNLHIDKIDSDKFYLYEVTGGEDFDVEDDGIINISPTPNRGVFHLLVSGTLIKKSTQVHITIVSEIIYQKVAPFITDIIQLKDNLKSYTKEIIQKDINGDGDIGVDDILYFNPIKDGSKLSLNYKNRIQNMVENILNGRAFDFQEEISPGGKHYPTTESGIQEALDDANYDYVISQLTTNSSLYGLSSDKINMNIAAAYVGKSGYTVFDITSAISGSSSNLNSFVSNITQENNAVDTINKLKKADDYYSSIIKDINCSDASSLTVEQQSSCFNLGLVKLTSLSNSVKLLFGGDETIVKKWADGVDINSSDDLNGNGVVDEADASACAIVYASNPTDNCKDGSMATYRKRVTFSKLGITYKTTLIDVDVGSSTLGYKTFNKLVTNNSSGDNSALLTDGVCDVNFNKTSNSIDGVTYFPCPVLNSGALMNISDALSNSANVQRLFPLGDDTRTTVDNYIVNITGSKNGVINQSNLSTYLQSH